MVDPLDSFEQRTLSNSESAGSRSPGFFLWWRENVGEVSLEMFITIGIYRIGVVVMK